MKLPQWYRMSKKIRERIHQPRYVGFFTEEDVRERGMRFVQGAASREGMRLTYYWMVDETDGVIADVQFQVFGPTALLAAADVASELMLRKNYDQASRLSAELIDRLVRDRKDTQAFPEECATFLNFVLEAIDVTVQQCLDLPFEASHEITPIEEEWGEHSDGIPGWEEFSEEKKLQIIDEVVALEIRPYVELDAGGVRVLGLRAGKEVRISYEGSCTSCHSSTGSTLHAIQRILRARVHPTLSVVPE